MARMTVAASNGGATATAVCDYSVTFSGNSATIKVSNLSASTNIGVRGVYLSVNVRDESGDYDATYSKYETWEGAADVHGVTGASFTKTVTLNDSHPHWLNLYVAVWTSSSSHDSNSAFAYIENMYCTVSYNANGGSGAPSSQKKGWGTDIVLSGTKPTRTNYVFKEWNTNSSGTGTSYAPGATYKGDSNLALYAIWYAPYTVSYDANGGTGAPSSQTKVHNQSLTLSSTKPTRSGYVFRRWNTNTSDTGTAYNPGATYTANANLALKAIWNPVISYNANGGSGAPSSQTKTYGVAINLSGTVPTRAGYSFWHWNTANNNSGTTYSPGSSYSANTSLSLYAIWNPIISYDPNGGSGAPLPQTKTYGTSITLSSVTPTRSGYRFNGWNTKADGTGTNYSGGAAYTSNATLTLYAKWLREPSAPSITSMSVVRCDSSGNADDAGTHCKVTVAWRVDTTSDTVSGNTGTVTGRVGVDGSAVTTAIAWSSGTSGTSGTAVAIVPNIDTDSQYAVTVTVTDRVTSTSRTDICTRAFFVIDFRAGGQGVGIGSAAPETGLVVGYDMQCSNDLDVLGDLEVAGGLIVRGNLVAPNLTVVTVSSGVLTPASGWTVVDQYAYTYGRVCMVRVGLRPSSAVAANTSQTVGTLASGYRPVGLQGFADASGVGQAVAAGTVTYRNLVALTTGSTVYVGLTFIKS